MNILKIPFSFNRKSGTLTATCKANKSTTEPGFDLFPQDGFDPYICLGYPSMHAFVSDFEGTGYAAGSAWIQTVTRHEYEFATSSEPFSVVESLDVHPLLEELGVPFFAMGFPAEIFDAPCNNLAGLGKLDWIASTFLVTLPCRINDYSISFIAGFRWGYCEYDREGLRKVNIKPLKTLGLPDWQFRLQMLGHQFRRWKFI